MLTHADGVTFFECVWTYRLGGVSTTQLEQNCMWSGLWPLIRAVALRRIFKMTPYLAYTMCTVLANPNDIPFWPWLANPFIYKEEDWPTLTSCDMTWTGLDWTGPGLDCSWKRTDLPWPAVTWTGLDWTWTAHGRGLTYLDQLWHDLLSSFQDLTLIHDLVHHAQRFSLHVIQHKHTHTHTLACMWYSTNTHT
jgi:hypothetical protein